MLDPLCYLKDIQNKDEKESKKIMAKSKEFSIQKIRNIGIIAHIDAGKTTTSEHLIYYSGAKHRLGGVDQGTTDTDYDPEEQQRGITIYSACIPFQWNEHTINLIDTPGHVDFTAEVERSLRVLDGAVCVFDAQKGVEAQSETVWRQANKYQVPRLAFINKMDVVGANFANVLAQIRERLNGHPLPLTIPIGSGSIKESHFPFEGIIDLLDMKAIYFVGDQTGKEVEKREIPASCLEEAKKYREEIFDVLSKNDDKDEITSLFLEGGEIPIATIKKVVREQTIRQLIQPVLCGSGREHIGIQPLLDAITDYLPSPIDRPAISGTNPKKKDKIESRKPDAKEPFAGLVFKVISSDHGDLFYIRIYSGVLKSNSRVYNAAKDNKEVIGKLFHVFADPSQREDLAEAYAGDIVAVIGLKDATTGDTLCETQHPILLETISFAEAVVSQSIEPESSADKQKLIDSLQRLCREDPTFIFQQNTETGQMLISGMGTLHLEVKKHRLERDFRLKVRVGKPLVSFRETLRNNIEVEGECIRQAGTTNLFAKLKVQFSQIPIPLTGAVSGAVVINKLKPNVLTPLLATAAERGLKNALLSGEYGYPLLQVQAIIQDATMDALASTEIAFEAAAADTVSRALRGNILILEPIMKLTVHVPDEFLGNIISDLLTRRANITRQESNGRFSEIEAHVPLAKMFDYADKIRSLSQGRAGASMEPHSYAPAAEEIVRMITGEV